MKSAFHSCGIPRHFEMCLVLVFLCSSLFSQEPEKKLPIPDAAARKTAAADIKEIYGDQFKKAKTNKQKIELAQQLIKDAEETKNNPASLYTLLRIARDIAVGAKDFDLATKAIDLLDAKFEVDALAMRVKVLLAASKSAKTKDANKELALKALTLTQVAIVQDKYDLAKQLSTIALSAARKTHDSKLVKRAGVVNQEIDTIKEQYGRVKLALESLEDKPTHPGANLTVGKFRCYYKGNWEEGLSMLALGSDAKLKELATTELKGPTSETAQLALAHGWWDLGETLEGLAQNNLKLHAGLWYRKVLPSLTGIAKRKVEKRLAELEGIASSSVASGQATKPNVPTEGLVAYWSFDKGSGNLARDSVGNNHGQISGARWVKGTRGGALFFDGIDDGVRVPSISTANRSFAICAWVKRSKKPEGYFLTQGSKKLHVGFRSATGFTFSFWNDDLDAKGDFSDTTNWHHWVVSFDSSTKRQAIILDGKLIASRTARGPHQGFGDLYIGRDGSGDFSKFNGAIDEVFIYNRELSLKEIGTLIKSVKLKNIVTSDSPSVDSGGKTAKVRGPIKEQWISEDATYRLSSSHLAKFPPLPSFLNESQQYHKDEYAFHTKPERGAWVTIDLGKLKTITRVYILNRKNFQDRAAGMSLYISSDGRRQQKVWTATQGLKEWNVKLPDPIQGRYVSLKLPDNVNQSFHLRKVAVFGSSNSSQRKSTRK